MPAVSVMPSTIAATSEPRGIAALPLRPLDARVEIRHGLGVGFPAHHLRQQLRELAVGLRIALAREQLGRDREIARLREAPRHVGDVLVHAEHLGDDEHHREVPAAGRHGAIGRHREAIGRHRDLARVETGVVGADRLRAQGPHGRGEAGAERCAHERAAVERPRGQEAFEVGAKRHGGSRGSGC